MGLYWLHCKGPDGPVVLLADYHAHTDTYDLIEDGRDDVQPSETNGEVWLHKWILVHKEPVLRPAFTDRLHTATKRQE